MSSSFVVVVQASGEVFLNIKVLNGCEWTWMSVTTLFRLEDNLKEHGFIVIIPRRKQFEHRILIIVVEHVWQIQKGGRDVISPKLVCSISTILIFNNFGSRSRLYLCAYGRMHSPHVIIAPWQIQCILHIIVQFRLITQSSKQIS